MLMLGEHFEEDVIENLDELVNLDEDINFDNIDII